MPLPSIRVDSDDVPRCAWVGDDELYRRYHDLEWGHPLHGDRALFEKISLEGFQSGLSWITILKRREGFRRAFFHFELESVAALGEADVESLLLDTGIIRNRQKIEATIANARIVRELTAEHPGALDELVWSFSPPPKARPRVLSEIPAVTPESTALSKALRGHGLRFVGPTTMYALMQSAGLVDDHVEGCHRAS